MTPTGAPIDAIVVGGGHNGLTAAAYLARAGLSVCALERRPILGGACVTEELWPGKRVSRASYVVSMLQPKVVEDLRLREFGYDPIPLDPNFATMTPEGDPIAFYNDTARTQDSIARHSPRDAAAYPGFEEMFERLAVFFQPMLLRPPPPPGSQAPTTSSTSCARARGSPASASAGAGALPRDDDAGRRAARGVVRVRCDQGSDGVHGSRRSLGRAAHAGNRLQPPSPLARRARRRRRAVGPRSRRHGSDLGVDRGSARGVGRRDPHRRGRRLDRRQRRASQRRHPRVAASGCAPRSSSRAPTPRRRCSTSSAPSTSPTRSSTTSGATEAAGAR